MAAPYSTLRTAISCFYRGWHPGSKRNSAGDVWADDVKPETALGAPARPTPRDPPRGGAGDARLSVRALAERCVAFVDRPAQAAGPRRGIERAKIRHREKIPSDAHPGNVEARRRRWAKRRSPIAASLSDQGSACNRAACRIFPRMEKLVDTATNLKQLRT